MVILPPEDGSLRKLYRIEQYSANIKLGTVILCMYCLSRRKVANPSIQMVGETAIESKLVCKDCGAHNITSQPMNIQPPNNYQQSRSKRYGKTRRNH